MKLAILMLLCACGGALQVGNPVEVACTTGTGVRVMAPVPAGYCAEFIAGSVEENIFKAFVHVVVFDDRFTEARQIMEGWTVVVVPVQSWRDDTGILVVGQTHCESRTIYVSNVRPWDSALGHEYAHAVQNCVPTQPWNLAGDAQDFYHSNWDPIYQSLKAEYLRP